ncbi:Uncharacterised protein [Neisseria meningitidis]|nr:Uncharacterised protein [Neisseria meningitidis]CWN79176.1 Uncharacterised protein [Neisseria meningitidis]CWN86187.1 Uncharacterised protein [Neisseria meningitidis]CWP56295.1 Uncharacterised protein [Neisseria meningitidis]CWP59001.1 Uncharacterised protein [Neisseria meningitidis]
MIAAPTAGFTIAPAAFAFRLAACGFAFAGRFHAFDGQFGQFSVNVFFDFVDFDVFVHFGKRNRNTRAACAAGAPDAVDVVFRLFRQVVVDNVGNGRYVDTACGNIGGNQNFAAAFTQIHQRAVAPALRHIAVQAVCGETFFVQFIRNDFGHGFGGRENHALIDIGIAQDMIEQAVFVAHIVAVQQLFFDFALIVHAFDFDDFRVFGQFARQFADRAVPSGGEQQSLTVARRCFHDGFDVVDKAHIQHTVGFVQNQHFQTFKINFAALHQVHQTARRGDNQIDRFAQGTGLVAERRAADDADGAEPTHIFGIRQRVFLDLSRQFAGRGQHQSTRAFARFFAAFGQFLQSR